MHSSLPFRARRLLSAALTTLVLLATCLVAVTLTTAPAQASGSHALSYGASGPRVVALRQPGGRAAVMHFTARR